VLFVADVAGVPGAPEPARRPGGAVPTTDRLRVPPPLPQLSHNACFPGSQGLVWLFPGEPLIPKVSVGVEGVLNLGSNRVAYWAGGGEQYQLAPRPKRRGSAVFLFWGYIHLRPSGLKKLP
jgi:hypothetical protein